MENGVIAWAILGADDKKKVIELREACLDQALGLQEAARRAGPEAVQASGQEGQARGRGEPMARTCRWNGWLGYHTVGDPVRQSR